MKKTSKPNPKTNDLPRCTIKVFGVGGAGGNALNHLADAKLPGVELSAMNTDIAALGHCNVASKLVLGSKSSRGLGAGGDPERGRQAAEEDLDQVEAICEGADVVFLVAGLGGGTGTGASPLIARAAKERGALVLSLVMLPFDCEGARRQHQAREGLRILRQESDAVICLPNQKVFKFIDDNTSLVEAFTITNEFVAQGVRGIWQLISQPGLINVDFADLCSITRGRHASSALITCEASGEHRIRNVIEDLDKHPLFDAGDALAQASSILVCIAGGPELGMREVEAIMDHIHRHNDQANVIMGTAVDPELEQKIVLTVVASLPLDEAAEKETAATTAPPESKTTAEPEAPSAVAPESPATAAAPEAEHTVPPEFEESHKPASGPSKSAARLVPPAPELPPEKAKEIYLERTGKPASRKKAANRMRQGQLPLEIISRGRFEKSEPTLYHGEDLDVPTYIRRGVPLN